MKFTCKTSKLRNAISKVERIVSKQTTLPILSNILLSCEKGQLIVAATNLEIAIKVYVGSKIEKEGSITIPARVLGGFLNTIRDEVIAGELGDNLLKINSENHKISIKGIDAKDFPIIPEIPSDVFIKINTEVFTRAVSAVLISVAHKDTRQELNGVLMKFEEGKIVLASTDSFRLTEVKLNEISIKNKEKYDAYREKNPSIVIPSLALMELQRMSEDGELEIMIEQSQLFISTESTKIISRLINGNYPEYKQVLPKRYDIEVSINKEEMINALKIASLISANQNGEVKFIGKKDDKKITVKAQSIDTGENTSIIGAKIIGTEFEVLFNCRYLLEGLNGVLFDKKDVVLRLNKQKSPVMLQNFKQEEGDSISFSYVIMPIIKG